MAEKITLGEVLDDLLIRFILHAPDEEETDARLFFQIEEAHWYYLDFFRENNPSLPDLKFKDFVDKILQRFPPLEHYRKALDEHTKKFIEYKTSVPVCGAVILNENRSKILLVKGWSKNSGWSFPRGKINRSESELNCAKREVEEETGFDILKYGANDKDFIEFVSGEQKVKLFVVTGVSENTIFTPQTRKEISAIEWHSLADLSAPRKSAGKFWAVLPHIRRINLWIAKNKQSPKKNVKRVEKSAKKNKVVSDKQFKILKRPVQLVKVQAAA